MVEDSIYIAPDQQGKGLGTILLGELLARCEALGFKQMIAVIGDAANNLPSARLHSIMGFTECGRIRNSGFKFNRWCDTMMMLALIDSVLCREKDFVNLWAEPSHRAYVKTVMERISKPD